MNFIDIHVGRYVRVCRESMGVSAEDAARSLNMTMEDLCEREVGRARFSAETLGAVCDLLQIRASEIYAGIEKPDAKRSNSAPSLS